VLESTISQSLKSHIGRDAFSTHALPADVAGQLHHFALGSPPCSLLARAPYDQFFLSDYRTLLRDLHHNVVDAETQLPPHLPQGQSG
jgi:hypothetical protein